MWRGKQKILRRLVLWNLLFKGKGRIKRILRLCHFEFFEKGERRHKIIQAVSPLFFWKIEKRDTKRIQAVSLCRILFGKGRKEWKDIAHFCFLWKNKVWKPENLESFLAKGEEERWEAKISRFLKSSSRNYKSCKSCWNASQGLAFIDFSCLVKKTIRRVITFRKNWKPLEELYLLIFIQNLSLVIDYQNHVIDYTKHLMKICDSSQLNLNFNVQIH